ncbi:MAG TPA: cardiolipin synthase [Gammaproteobacteria bacterium]|nr:cardiolipin synthase [Gammaproteobacteria bacterium]
MSEANWLALGALALHWLLVVGLSARIIMRRRPLGILLTWIALILSVPVLGVLIYLIVGENRVSRTYLRRVAATEEQYGRWKASLAGHAAVSPSAPAPETAALQRLAHTLVGFPSMGGNAVQLLQDCEGIFAAVGADIRHSRHSCHLEFYLWEAGGRADMILDELLRAASRGVRCRILLDAVGSKSFLKSDAAQRLRDAPGVELAAALPVGPVSALFSRADLRNHRKLVVIDGEIAYTGSQNLVDPRLFKQDEGVGQWIDAMVRAEGPAVEALAGLFIQDWEVVTGQRLADDEGPRPVAARGPVTLQAVPSGPLRPLVIQQLVIGTIYAARRELVITSPYFIPDDSVLLALVSAANRGVEVTVIVPARNDSRLVDYASRAIFDDLLAAGVRIAAFEGGLLHTKSITVDGEFSLFGSLNLDMRSLWLNFELTLFIYDAGLSSRIRDMQFRYLADSSCLDADEYRSRPLSRRFLENAVHLVAPLL